MATDCNFRFQEGLETLGVLEMMKQHPEVMKEGFLHKTTHLSAEGMEDLLELPLFAWSEDGSNKKGRKKGPSLIGGISFRTLLVSLSQG